jgi:hypothetical protein
MNTAAVWRETKAQHVWYDAQAWGELLDIKDGLNKYFNETMPYFDITNLNLKMKYKGFN